MILLIRHGETALNVARIVQPADTPLSDHGREQARRLASRVRAEPALRIERVLASDLLRARETAEALVSATGVEIEYSPLLQERNFGDLRGRPYAEFGVDIFAREYAPPGGESWPEFEARVARAWALVVNRAAELSSDVAVVTHGLVCRAIAARFLTLSADECVPERWGNTSLTLCAKAAPHSVQLLNCSAHLDPASIDRSAPSGM